MVFARRFLSTRYFRAVGQGPMQNPYSKVVATLFCMSIFFHPGLLHAKPKVSGYYWPDIGKIYRTRGLSALAEFEARFPKKNSVFTARYFFRGFGQVPFDSRSTKGSFFGVGGETYQNEIGGVILGLEHTVAPIFFIRGTIRAMNTVVFPGGLDPTIDPLASTFLMGHSRYFVFGIKSIAGGDDAEIEVLVEWGREPAAAANFVRARANGQVEILLLGPLTWRLRGMVEDLGGRAPFAEAIRIGGSTSLRGYTANRYLGDRGAGLSLEAELEIGSTEAGSLILVAYGDVSRAWATDLSKSGGPLLWSDWGKSVGLGLRHRADSSEAALGFLQLDIAVGKDPWIDAWPVKIHLEFQPWSTDWLSR